MLDETFHPLSGQSVVRVAEQRRAAGVLNPEPVLAFVQFAPLAQDHPVVGGENDQRIAFESERIQGIDQVAAPPIDMGAFAGVEIPDALEFGGEHNRL